MADAAAAPSQAVCVAALYGDLVLHTLLHDARGSLVAVSGWMELAAMDGQTVPPGLERGFESLSEILATAEHSARLPTAGMVPAAELLEGLPGAQRPIDSLRVQACWERFRTVISLAAPEWVEVQAGKRSDRAVVTIGGLAAEGVSLAGRPVLSDLAALRADPLGERALAAALLRPLAWACGGSLRTSETTTVEITLKGEMTT
jgi:hypothetical protein